MSRAAVVVPLERCIDRPAFPVIPEGRAGIHRRGAFVEAVLGAIPSVPFGLPEARRHAQVWAELSKGGRVIGPHDLLIAATALAHNLALATLNRREFSRVSGLRLAAVEAFLVAG